MHKTGLNSNGIITKQASDNHLLKWLSEARFLKWV